MKTLTRSYILAGMLALGCSSLQASVITSNDIDFDASSWSKPGGGWSVTQPAYWQEIFDQDHDTSLHFDRDLDCTNHNRWGSCTELGNAGSSISHDPIVLDIVFHKEWDITSHDTIDYYIKKSHFKFFDINDIEVNKNADSFENVINAKFFVTDTKNQHWMDGDFWLKEIEMHGTHSSLRAPPAGDKPQVDVSAPATLGLMSLAGMLMLRKRV